MATYTRTSSNLIGSPGTPATISAAASTSGTLSIGSGNGNVEGTILVRVTIGSSAPTTNPTVQFLASADGTNYYAVGGPIVVPIGATSTSYDYEFDGPVAAQSLQVTVANGATNGITAYAQGVVLGVS